MITRCAALSFLAATICIVSCGAALADPLDEATSAYENRDYAKAVQLVRPLADRGVAKAQLYLGVMYGKGQGFPQDFAESSRWMRKAADQGNASAQFNLAAMYRIGQGVPKSDVDALQWYRKAAEQGVPEALFLLGVRYGSGQGVPQDSTEELKMYLAAAERGHLRAQYNVGAIFGSGGKDIPTDYVRAQMWFNLAASAGLTEAVKARDLLATAMAPADLEEAERLTREWRPIRESK